MQADDVNTSDQVWRHDYMATSDEALLVVVSVNESGGWALNEWTWIEAQRLARSSKRTLSVRLVQTRFDVLITALQLAYVLEDKTIVKADTPSAYFKLRASVT